MQDLGHCMDSFDDWVKGVGVGHRHPEDLERTEHRVYRDRTMLAPSDLHPWTASLFTSFDIPKGHRMLHRSVFPLCTFGYAVTRAAAAKILTTIAPPMEIPSRHTGAYDVAILKGCNSENGGQLRCYSLQPELFHHMPAKAGDGIVAKADGNERKPALPPLAVAGIPQDMVGVTVLGMRLC